MKGGYAKKSEGRGYSGRSWTFHKPIWTYGSQGKGMNSVTRKEKAIHIKRSDLHCNSNF